MIAGKAGRLVISARSSPAARCELSGGAPMFTRRIFLGVVATWFLLEGSKGLWRLWAAQRAGSPGFLGTAAADVLEVTG